MPSQRRALSHRREKMRLEWRTLILSSFRGKFQRTLAWLFIGETELSKERNLGKGGSFKFKEQCISGEGENRTGCVGASAGGWVLSEPGSGNPVWPSTGCAQPVQLYWLFAELSTVCHYLQSLELFAKLVIAYVTIWRAWHCLSFCGVAFHLQRLVLLGEASTAYVTVCSTVHISVGVVGRAHPPCPSVY
jgi:hypothetical protein